MDFGNEPQIIYIVCLGMICVSVSNIMSALREIFWARRLLHMLLNVHMEPKKACNNAYAQRNSCTTACMWTHKHVHHGYWPLIAYLNLSPARDHCWMVFQSLILNLLDPLLTQLSSNLLLDYPCLSIFPAYLYYRPRPGLLTKFFSMDFIHRCLNVASLCSPVTLILHRLMPSW